MAQIDLRTFVVTRSGTLASDLAHYLPNKLTLTKDDDTVTLQGHLRLRITFYARDYVYSPGQTTDQSAPLANGSLPQPTNLRIETNGDSGNFGERNDHLIEFLSYVLEIPSGRHWRYTHRGNGTIMGPVGTAPGYTMTIEPAGEEIPPGISPPDTDIPCNIAVADLPDIGEFFPSACEPCQPETPRNLPPGTGQTLNIPPAGGGCVRPRFFNGMFITSEDMENLLRWTRVKQQMQNRAMGQGVVWGLKVDRDGHHIRVHPGYAVDCCGNELVVTTPYCVDINTLLADPASFPRGDGPEPHRMHLLLEYHECPEGPRPVHGDPCSPEVSSCEMSRMRETVRLRLVPPRDYQAQGPLGDFLDEIETYSGKAGLSDSVKRSEGKPAFANDNDVFFLLTLSVEGDVADSIETSRTIDFEINQNTEHEFALNSQDNVNTSLAAWLLRCNPKQSNIRIRFRLKPPAGYTLLREAAVKDVSGVIISELDQERRSLSWDVSGSALNVSEFYRRIEQFFNVINLNALDSRSTQRKLTCSRFSITISFDFGDDISAVSSCNPKIWRKAQSYVRVTPVTCKEEAVQAAPWPCVSTACSTNGTPLFPAPPPWLYANPGDLTDFRGLAVRGVYNFLLSQLKRSFTGSREPTATEKMIRFVDKQVERFLGHGDAGRGQVTERINKLLSAWCESLLYPGPQCRELPHGVVIGCVIVSGGSISSIDPWGGRRHVMHYPLLAQWGEQLGIVAPDELASRLMTMMCCLGELPPETSDTSQPSFSRPLKDIDAPPKGSWLKVGNAILQGPETAEAPTQLAKPVIETENVNFSSILKHAVEQLLKPSITQTIAGYRRYEDAVTGVRLFVPIVSDKPTSLEPDREREQKIVRRGIDESGVEIPPLLEEFANDLTMAALDMVPLRIRDDSPAREHLRSNRLLSAGSVLRYRPEDVYARIAESKNPREVTEVIQDNRQLAQEVAGLVARSIRRLSDKSGVLAADELASDENRTTFISILKNEQKDSDAIPEIPDIAMEFVVQRALRRATSGRR